MTEYDQFKDEPMHFCLCHPGQAEAGILDGEAR